MTVTLTYVGEHHVVEMSMANMARLALTTNNQVQYALNPHPLDLQHSALEITVEGVLLDQGQELDWDFQNDLALVLETLNDPRWKLATMRQTMLYQVIKESRGTTPSQIVFNRLTNTRH